MSRVEHANFSPFEFDYIVVKRLRNACTTHIALLFDDMVAERLCNACSTHIAFLFDEMVAERLCNVCTTHIAIHQEKLLAATMGERQYCTQVSLITYLVQYFFVASEQARKHGCTANGA